MPTVIEEENEARAEVVLRLDSHGRAALSPMQVADALEVGLSYVYKVLNTGELRSFALGGRRKITVADLEEFIAKKLAAGAPMRRMPWDQGEQIMPRRYWPRHAATRSAPAESSESGKRKECKAERKTPSSAGR